MLRRMDAGERRSDRCKLGVLGVEDDRPGLDIRVEDDGAVAIYSSVFDHEVCG